MAYFIGLMSGTSMDGVDAVLCDITKSSLNTLDAVSETYPPALLNQLHGLCQPEADEINRLGFADTAVARVYAQAVFRLLNKAGVPASTIRAIGSHGQTIRHYPPAETHGFTLQIGDPNTLAALTGIDVVADFRRKDMALGGQGAPLAPRFHQALFADENNHRAVINIGGIANITLLPPTSSDQAVTGFDTGPGNTLLDAWCMKHIGKAFDQDGRFASSGKVSQNLLNDLLGDPYFRLSSPKSTGREYFNLAWLSAYLSGYSLPAEDIQATLVALTAHSIAQSLPLNNEVSELYVCGGGAHNPVLMALLMQCLPKMRVTSTSELGLAPQLVEGAGFAWLAWAYINRVTGNLPSVTGAGRTAVLGTLCPGE
ncbi:anhydro-N-acetylmuramic acid kinase [Alteromonas aestuariivivens]|uniref:Anhydro-N-acetylmuramic acid kinase n=1 Tax=Alteromonas aestuariivivens TaxID=1938339 RepID=A0A3D8MDR2_9ALTE|nr:anhydro-N-acetylmuramic acid kinase [Alteromonas aestuariivivens]RDV28975.1 anhydro-N-acetylmuramic acid kinase [Alteromonas aestuariivivens]